MRTRLDNIPEELKTLNRWVFVSEDSKVPKVWTGFNASSSDPRTWCDFSTVTNHDDYDFAGFVFNNDGLVGIDIDEGYDEEGFLSVLAADIIKRCGSYTEKSRSGRGFHIIVKGELPFSGRNNRAGVEMYRDARYFIMTGDTLFYKNIEENQQAIDYIVEKYFPDVRVSEGKITVDRFYAPRWEAPADGRIKLRPVYPQIPDGCRNISLTSLGGLLHNQGYSGEQIYDELMYCNTVACKPMLSRGEVKQIVRSVTRYKR